MRDYFNNIVVGIRSFWKGLSLTFKHMKNKEDLVATLQYPNEQWPIPERNIGYENSEYNVIRSRLHVDMDDCIGCLQCERACPVDCIKIDTLKPSKDSEFDCGKTSHGTQKKLVVPRFTIDMSECMYCNLCVYPCPEECIYMVGGPNEEKHEIDYEFSKYTRDGLIFEFADATDKDIIEAGGEDYIKSRQEKENRLKEGQALNGKEIPIEEKPLKKKETTSEKKKASIVKPDFSIVNEIEDKVVRATAKKAFNKKFKEGASFEDIAQFIKVSLEEAGKYSSDLDDVIDRISKMTKPDVADENNTSTSSEELTHKSFSSLEDKKQRGIVKKIFIIEKKKGLSDSDILNAIRAELEKKELLTDDALKLLDNLSSNNKIPKIVEKKSNDIFDLKKLNIIEDKMLRGLAKKVYIKSKKDGMSSEEILLQIESELGKVDKLTDDVKNIISSIRNEI
mgnify:CR=1 FL=1